VDNAREIIENIISDGVSSNSNPKKKKAKKERKARPTEAEV
jgi:hypothetical protein